MNLAHIFGLVAYCYYKNTYKPINRFHELLDELQDTNDPISTKNAMRHFSFTLGPEYATIKNNFCIRNVPSQWTTQEWPKLLALCWDCFNSVKHQGVSYHDSLVDSGFDCAIHHKKVQKWFLKPFKFCQEIVLEQHNCDGKCIYHLSQSHPMAARLYCEEKP